MTSYAQVHPKLKELLQRFGPRRKVDHTEHPFWRMRCDGIWELDRPDLVTPNSSGDASPKELRDLNIHGGLYEEDYIAFRRNPRLAWRTVNLLLDLHFPESYREDILQATGIVQALRNVGRWNAPSTVRELSLGDSRHFGYANQTHSCTRAASSRTNSGAPSNCRLKPIRLNQ